MSQVPRSYFLWADLFPRKRDDATLARINALRDSLLFCTLSDSELEYLCGMIHERVYEKGEVIFRQNERGFGLYAITYGKVSIRAQGEEKETEIATLTGGSFFGELALIEEENFRNASAVALERTVLIGFFKPDLMEILHRRPEMGVKILLQLSMVLGRRLMETTEQFSLLQVKRGDGEAH